MFVGQHKVSLWARGPVHVRSKLIGFYLSKVNPLESISNCEIRPITIILQYKIPRVMLMDYKIEDAALYPDISRQMGALFKFFIANIRPGFQGSENLWTRDSQKTGNPTGCGAATRLGRDVSLSEPDARSYWRWAAYTPRRSLGRGGGVRPKLWLRCCFAHNIIFYFVNTFNLTYFVAKLLHHI